MSLDGGVDAELRDPYRMELLRKIEQKLPSELPLSMSLLFFWFADTKVLEKYASDEMSERALLACLGVFRGDFPGPPNYDTLIGFCKFILEPTIWLLCVTDG